MARRIVIVSVVGTVLGALGVMVVCVLASVVAFTRDVTVTVPFLWEVWTPEVDGIKQVHFLPNFVGAAVCSLVVGAVFGLCAAFIGGPRAVLPGRRAQPGG